MQEAVKMATLDKEMAEKREDKIKQNLPGGPGEARNQTGSTQLQECIVDDLGDSWRIPPFSDSSNVCSLQSIGSRGFLENVNQAKRSPPSSKLHSPKTSTANPPSSHVAPSSGLPPPSAAMSAPKATAASATSLSGATADMKQSPFGLKAERKSSDLQRKVIEKDKTIKDLQCKVIEKDKTIKDLEGKVDTLKAKRQEDKYKMKELKKTKKQLDQKCVGPEDAERPRDATEQNDQQKYNAKGRFEDPNWSKWTFSGASVPLSSSSSQQCEPSIVSSSSAAAQLNPFVSSFLTAFELGPCLGKGAFGVVFKAKHKLDKCHYAIKIIRLPKSAIEREKVLREAETLAKLDHPFIVRYYNSWSGWMEDNSTTSGSSDDTSSSNSSMDLKKHSETESDGGVKFSDTNEPQIKTRKYLFIQMELCDRNTLKDRLKTNTQINHLKCLNIFEQIVGAVKYFHGMGIIHGDLKPANIFFSLDGRSVKVGDFGLVTASVQEPADNTTKGKSDANHAGQVGTYLYMSPDKIKGRAADVFSLGLIFFELFQSFSTEMERIKTMSEVRKKNIPEEFITNMNLQAQLVEWMLADSPESRPKAAEICVSDTYKKIMQLHSQP